MKKSLFFILVLCFINTIALASGNVSEKQEYLKRNYVANGTGNYDKLDVYGVLNFFMQYSESLGKWNYEQAGLTWDEVSKAIDGNPDVIFNKLSGRFVWKEANGFKVLVKLFINNNNFFGIFDGKYFKNLEELYCQENQISEINVSKNINLKKLNCSYNILKKLDVSRNLGLTYLNFSSNQLEELDITKNVNLTSLSGFYNKLTELNVTQNLKLTNLIIYANNIYSLDLLNNSELVTLDCDGNNLKKLDVSKNVKLNKIDCSNNALTQLDFSNNINLNTLLSNGNGLNSLNISKNVNLVELYCYSNQLKELDVSKNINLINLFCYSNNLTALDVSKNVNLINLSCDSNELITLDVSKNVNLINLSCDSNKLTTLDVSNNVSLATLNCEYNQLTSLIVPKVNNLSKLVGHTNQLKLSTLQGDFLTIKSLILNPQNTLNGGTKGYFDILDLSSEYIIDGKLTSYTWIDKSTKQEVNMFALKGKFIANTENAGKTLICQMKNELFPGFILEYEVAIKDEMVTTRNINESIPEGFKLVGPHANLSESVQLTPNPVVDNVKINSSARVESVNVYSYSGREVKRIPKVKNNELNLQDLPSGIYMITIKTEQGIINKKIIKR